MTKTKTPSIEPVSEQNSEAGKPEKSPIDVQDAWNHSFDLIKGIDNLLYGIACSDDGMTPDGATALIVISDRLREHAKIINEFFNPEAEE